MKIQIVTADSPVKTKGNSITAVRWSRFCRQLGHRVNVSCVSELNLEWNPDCLIALHAKKTAGATQAFDRRLPERSVVVMLTGTDVYSKAFESDPKMLFSVTRADRLVVLQSEALNALSAILRKKTTVIYQSAQPPRASRPQPLRSCIEVCVAGHLRAEKDPFRTALAASELPDNSRIRVNHYGAALTAEFKQEAESLSKSLKCYHWFGEYPRWKILQRIARSRLLVLSSESEGGAGVLSEAIAVGTPIIASRIAGNVGILGNNYPGYFDLGDTKQLRDLLWRFESDANYRRRLASATKKLKPRVSPRREKQSIRKLLSELEKYKPT